MPMSQMCYVLAAIHANTRQIKLIYSDILVTGRLVSWASGPLYSDVDISDTSSQDSPNLFFHGGSKVQLEFIV